MILVQQKPGAQSSGAVTTLELDTVFTAPVTVGNAIAVAFQWSIGGTTPSLTLSDDKANTYTIVQNILDPFSGDNLGIAYLLNATNGPQTFKLIANSVGAGSIFLDCQIYEVSGVGSFDNSNNGTNAIGTALLGTLLTANANDFAWAAASVATPATYTQNNGWTQDSANSSVGDFYFHNFLTASGANTINATSNVSTHHAWVLGAFAPASTVQPTGYSMESAEYY